MKFITDKEIIEAAREADIFLGDPFGVTITPELRHFTKIIESKTLEKAAVVCEKKSAEWYGRNTCWQHHQGAATGADCCASAIRSLKDQS